jgi:hypothetical protein
MMVVVLSHGTMDYEAIVKLSRSEKPPGMNKQTWDRIKRVARSPRLAALDPEYLPGSLTALTELLRLPERRFRLLEENGLLCRETSARELKEIGGTDGPLRVQIEALIWPDGKVEMGKATPIGKGRSRGVE